MSEISNLKFNLKEKAEIDCKWCNLCKQNSHETEQCWFNPKNNISGNNEKT